MRRLKRSRRGQATAIGSLFFFVIAVLLVNFLYEINMIQIEMNQFDAERAQERIEISAVLFGDQKTYSAPNSTTIISGSGIDPFTDPYVTAVLTTNKTYPIPNMYFDKDADGWTFSFSYYGTGSGSSGASGSFTTEPPTGSSSGAGAIYASFTYNPPSGTTAGVIMNWTTRFYIDLESLGGASAIDSASLSWERICSEYDIVRSASVELYLRDADGVYHLVQSVSIPDRSSWIKSTNDVKSLITKSGWYNVIIKITAELGHSGATTPTFKMYLDDIVLTLNTNSYVTDWYGTFAILEDPLSIKEIDIVYAGHYNVTLSQSVYILDASSERWILLDRSTISTSSRTLRFTLSGVDVSKYVSPQGYVKIRVFAAYSSVFKCIADSMTLTDYFTGSRDYIVLTFRNIGGVYIHLVSLWVIDSLGHHHFDSQSTPSFDLYLSPGEKKTYRLSYSWSEGTYIFKVVTEKGTITTYSVTV